MNYGAHNYSLTSHLPGVNLSTMAWYVAAMGKDFTGANRTSWDMGAYDLTTTPPPACTYAVSTSSQSFGASGGAGSVRVTTQSGCAWSASTGASWISISSGASGTGSGTVRYVVRANSGPARTAGMTIAGQVFTVTEAGASRYTITASAAANGSISPSGSVSVASGANQSFSISPNRGYRISNVTVDGRSVGAVSSYTFTNVTANHTIAATFARRS